MLHKVLMMAALALGLFGPVAAHAQQQGDVSAAANAFAQAQRAELNEQYARAAELYELADRVVPAPEALRNATRAWLAAGRHVSAATSAEELLRRYGQDATSRELAEEVLGRTQPELSRWAVTCSDPCTLAVSGLAIGTEPRTEHVVYLEPGPYTLTARFAQGDAKDLRVEAKAGEAQTAQLSPEPSASQAEEPAPPAAEAPVEARVPTQPASPSEPRGVGVSPTYFWVALSATAVVGGVALWSGIDLLNARDAFEADETPSRKAFRAGETKDLRTSLLIGSAAALAVGTAVLAVFTDFRGRKGTERAASRRTPRAAASPIGLSADRQGAHVLFKGAF